MTKNRLEAFSDGVMAIIITIMVLELKVPHGDTFEALAPLLPVFGSYLLSFIYVAIYWNNHHHMLHAVDKVDGAVLWANVHLLFWLSIIPFTTSWMGENHFSKLPVAVYGFVLMINGVAYSILARTLVRLHGKGSVLATALGKDWKGWLSIVIYACAVLLSLVLPVLALVSYTAVALMWLIPDRRIERRLIMQEKDGR